MEPADDDENIANALGATVVVWSKKRLGYLVAEVELETALRAIQPDFSKLKSFPYHGYCVTCEADASDIDFVSRFFAPAMGINEDPVTGSVHCVLGPYWAAKLGKTSLTAHQASTRGGDLQVDIGENSVTLGGQAVTTMRGELLH